jgi:hypothetical protein
MKHVKIITMALLAVFCLSAVAASNAFAVEAKGEISKNIAKGEAPTLKSFKGESAKEGFLETAAGSKISCTKTSLKGKINTTKTGEATFTFTGCASAGLKCKSGAEAAGTIVVAVGLEGAVESKTDATKEKDYLLNKAPKTEIACSTIHITVLGNLLVPVAPEPLRTLQLKYTFNAKGAKGVQTPEISAAQGEHLRANFANKGLENASMQAEGLETTFEEKIAFI